MSQISVIVPVYKCADYIHRCVDSILNQTFSDFELILVDDGSPDNCGEICEEYAKKDSRIKVLHQENGGQASARNSGVKISQSEWLHFVDSDDAIHPKMLETLYNNATENNVKISMCSAFQGSEIPEDFNKSFEDSKTLIEMTEENILHLCKNEKYYYWIVCAKLIHKSIFEKYSFTEGRIYEDNAIVCKWLYEAKKVTVNSAPLYFYYVNTESTTKKNFTEKRLDVLWAFKEQIEFFDSLGYEKMLNHLCTYYFEISANMYRNAKNENGKKLIPFIKEQEKYIQNKYSRYIDLNYAQKLYYYERTNKPMYYITRVINKLKNIKGH